AEGADADGHGLPALLVEVVAHAPIEPPRRCRGSPPRSTIVSDTRHSPPREGHPVPNAQAAASALDVLEHLSRHAEPLPAASIARDLSMPRSSVYHLLRVLIDRGYVTHYAEERRYGLGPAAYELGSAYQRQAPLARVARSAIRRLSDQCGRNTHFATLD